MSKQWTVGGSCVKSPYYYDTPFILDENPATSNPKGKSFPVDFPLYPGWTLCLTARTFHQHMTYLDFILRQNSSNKLFLSIKDDSHIYNNALILHDSSNEQFYDKQFGTQQNFHDEAHLNINFTLVAFTQIRVDFGPPISHSMITELVDANYLTSVNFIRLQCNGMTVETVDLDCKHHP